MTNTYIIDTRENHPYEIIGAKEKTLKTGDYSVEGYEDRIAVERKAFSDLYNCLTTDTERFEKQLQRLSKFDHSYLIIDSTVSGLLLGSPYSDVPGEVILKRLVRLYVKYKVPFCFAENKGAKITQNLLNEAVKTYE